jgi:hypothetical protein
MSFNTRDVLQYLTRLLTALRRNAASVAHLCITDFDKFFTRPTNGRQCHRIQLLGHRTFAYVPDGSPFWITAVRFAATVLPGKGVTLASVVNL